MLFYIIFIAIPFIEIMLFMTVGQAIGFFTTLGIAFLTAIIGGALVKHQGLHTLAHIQGTMQRGQLPARELFDGICLLIAGAVLITPGFLTDFIGFALLIPPVRSALRHVLQEHIGFTEYSAETSYEETNMPPADIIEGDYERVDNSDNR